MADDIVQRIVLVGDREFTSTLNEVAEAGARAFDKLREASEVGLLSAQGIGIVFGGMVASAGLLTAATFEFTKAMSESVDTAKNLGLQLGITTEEVSGLQAAFADAGIGGGEMQQAFRRLSVSVQQSWAEIKQASRESADKLKGDILSIEQAQLSYANSQRELSNLERDQSDARVKSTNALKDAELQLRSVRAQQLRDRGFDTSLQDESIKRARDKLTLDNAQQAVADAQLKKSREQAEQEAAAAAARLKVQKDQLELSNLQRKAEDDRKNDINNVIDAVKRVAQGDGDALKDINASADNLVKGIVGAAGDASKALGQLRGDITDLASPAPEAKTVLETLGKTLENIQDPMLRTAVAARLLGRSVTQDLINVLSDPAKIKAFQDRIHELGLEINHTDTEIAEKFRSSLFSLENDFQLVGIKIGTVFGPTFTAMMDSVDQALTSNKDAFIALAQAINVDVVRQFLDVMNSLGSLSGSALKLLGQELQQIADVLNSITGADFSALDIALAPVVAGFKILGTVLDAINTSIQVIKAALSGDFSGVFERIGAVLDLLLAKFKALGSFLTGDFKQGMADVAKANEDYANRIKAMDAVEKQVSDGRQRRLRELADESKKTADEATDDQKKALDKADLDHKNSVANRVNDLKQLESASKNTAAQQKSISADVAKATQTVGAPGTSGGNFGGSGATTTTTTTTNNNPGGANILPGPQGTLTPNALSAAFKAVAEKTGIPLQHLSALADGQGGFEFFDDRKGVGGNFLPGLSNKVGSTNDFGGIERPTQNEGASVFNTKDELTAHLEEQTKLLKEDFDRQAEFNKEIAAQNGGLQTLRKGQVSPGYPPPVLGHYDPVSQAFIPNNPNSVGMNFDPKNNDFIFGGQKNPFPYQPGINAPLSFPSYVRSLMDSLPSSVPLPQPRPPEADAKVWTDAVKQGIDESKLVEPTRPFSVPPGSDSATGIPTGGLPDRPPTVLPTEQSFSEKMQTTGSVISDFFQNLLSKIQGLNPTDTKVTEPSNLGIRGDAGSTDATDATKQFASGTADATDSITQLASAASSAAESLSKIQGGGTPATIEAATGGFVRGVGTETSDSIPAWLSVNEFVTHAGATRFWGEDFMHAINRMDLSTVAARMPKFSTGGLVGLMSPRMPRFNAGGLVTGEPAFAMPHLGKVDLTTDHGTVPVMVDRVGLGQLRRAAVLKNVGTNKKSSWVKG